MEHQPLLSVAQANAPYHLLAGLTRPLWLPALVCSSGQAAQRLGDLAAWEQALLAGHLPLVQADGGDGAAFTALRQAVGELELCALSQGNAAMTQQILRTMLWHLDRLIDRKPDQSRDSAIVAMVQAFRDEWQEQREGWEEVMALLQGLGNLALQRWDEMRGVLQQREWQEAQRVSGLLAALPQLVAFIDQVGRARHAVELPPRPQPVAQARGERPMALRAVQTRLVDQPSEVRGIKRSGQISRMVAAEAMHMRHPVLRRLWLARLAEQQLLTYEDEAVLTQWISVPDESAQVATLDEPEPLIQGPMMVCLDTSGSMRGAPENVAKACVLQALRSAHQQKRRCLMTAFGGPDEVLEQELSLDLDGLQALLAVMGRSFDGGTDVQTPLEQCIERVRAGGWALADILIVSDGEFGVTPATLALLRQCKSEQGLRVHGILIGDRETIGLMEVCDELHWVRDWRRYASDARDAYGDGFSPVHSRSLTALYFPNAIRRP